jgi:hypothetical protein
MPVMEVGAVVKVIKDFLSLNDGEYCVTKDDILQVTEVVDRHWVQVRGPRDLGGLVPTGNIHTVENLPHSLGKGHSLLVADAHFNSEAEGDLTIIKGDIIVGLETVDASWTRGRNMDGQVGIFPTSFCWELEATSYISQAACQVKVEKFAQVVHSMQVKHLYIQFAPPRSNSSRLAMHMLH